VVQNTVAGGRTAQELLISGPRWVVLGICHQSKVLAPNTGNLLYKGRGRFGLAGASSGRYGHATRAGIIVRCTTQEQEGGTQERRREGGARERGKGQRSSLGLRAVCGKVTGPWVVQ
jgi:hypothetical protein